jgi:hypothetical protein
MNIRNRIVMIITLIILSGIFICACGNEKETKKISITDENKILDESTYSVNTFKDASITIVEDSITDKSISVKIAYTGKYTGTLGSWFSVEIYRDGKWYKIPYIKDNIDFNDEAYPIDETGFRIMDYEWNDMYRALPAGKYRVITIILDFVEPGNFKDYYLAAEFNIEQEIK